jgi:hypothetical protein
LVSFFSSIFSFSFETPFSLSNVLFCDKNPFFLFFSSSSLYLARNACFLGVLSHFWFDQKRNVVQVVFAFTGKVLSCEAALKEDKERKANVGNPRYHERGVAQSLENTCQLLWLVQVVQAFLLVRVSIDDEGCVSEMKAQMRNWKKRISDRDSQFLVSLFLCSIFAAKHPIWQLFSSKFWPRFV